MKKTELMKKTDRIAAHCAELEAAGLDAEVGHIVDEAGNRVPFVRLTTLNDRSRPMADRFADVEALVVSLKPTDTMDRIERRVRKRVKQMKRYMCYFEHIDGFMTWGHSCNYRHRSLAAAKACSAAIAKRNKHYTNFRQEEVT